MMYLRSVFLLLPVLALTACNTPSARLPEVTDQELAEEERIQQAMIDEAAKTGGHPRPWRKAKNASKRLGEVADRIEPVAAKICQEMGLPKLKRRCYFYFRMGRGAEINAYADGDQIFVTSGMMSFVANDDELALVLGHEVAHNLMGHRKAMEENMELGGMLGDMLAGIEPDLTASERRELGASGTMAAGLAYSTEFEAEADYIGLYIAARAGYDVRKAIQIWRRWAVENPESQYIAITHPTKPARFAMLQRTIKEIEAKKKQRLPLVPDLVKEPIEGDYETKGLLDVMF